MSTPKDINRYFYAVEMGKGLGLEIKAFDDFFQILTNDKCVGIVGNINSLIAFMEGYREGTYKKS